MPGFIWRPVCSQRAAVPRQSNTATGKGKLILLDLRDSPFVCARAVDRNYRQSPFRKHIKQEGRAMNIMFAARPKYSVE
ncbi:hypothetical protein [Sphingobium vermicomposti]|uniref:hypothetical protein n=1 Tax=Sphingobium vermicomposti TaxID=529005 RepID=UPI00141EDD05|nr:hypothetical protein [Sphingobium vermicomposti]